MSGVLEALTEFCFVDNKTFVEVLLEKQIISNTGKFWGHVESHSLTYILYVPSHNSVYLLQFLTIIFLLLAITAPVLRKYS